MDAERLREDFPIYSSQDRDIIYLDNACQTFRPRQVIEAMNSYYADFPACGGRSVHRLATLVSLKLDEAREKVAGFIGCSDPDRIVFTKNCTEALNLVAKGYPFKKGDAVLTTDMEHNSNHVPWLQMSERAELRHRYVATPSSGIFDVQAYRGALMPDVRMVSMVHTNNVTGTTIPEKEVIELAHERNIPVMLDGAQSVPHRKIDVEALDVDLLTFSVHKMLGPAGVGVLYAKEGMLERIEPLIGGGGGVGTTDYGSAEFLPPPEKFESGLQNYSGIIGSGAAVQYLESIGMDEVREHEARLNTLVTDGLKDIEQVSILKPLDPRLRSGVFSFNVRGMSSHDVAMIIDEMAKVQMRSGMHCVHPFFLSRNIDGCARASFYVYNTEAECKRFVEAVKEIVDTFSS
ncbi:aminotransferase class V-fold PLP-dependent enzyme [Methanomassiliicoccus luminyensis]|uniref:aminotransferase class V-fold PLP-dependent enzyme n=1 Tax=Methanomassiliicoccus luminyensis TaxID=1080712 RepID=UPI000361777D|nr:cysteine desulfurase [Methanomassiliicoccus luminyensis]